ncbi:structural maintenance of chromosomes flexible hinge domain-containing protein 1 isoform X2 [Gouania willdenowi]|uniref:structural maintenance of chromosomes flexible hinge domain-containing protein 1 isoform X2 n=1 Tax=Gouania willdenowi TaxID=441366 RepID=UPI00105505BE|nr:structural maintenance of chromosomes flexible hinge domain-containing protein 1 isoform X2 [Gouania willdenowi]
MSTMPARAKNLYMITKTESSPDVHELVISEEDFMSKESKNEDVFSGTIKNRRPGDSTHITKNDENFLHSIIAAEQGKKSFTAVVITGIKPKNITFMKEEFDVLTRQLSHIYHYYIHGVNGRNLTIPSTNSKPDIDIVLMMRKKPPQLPREVNLRDIEDDMQSLYINSAADTFEFKAVTRPDGTVEGIIRYHPFLYDKETYPKEPNAAQDSPSHDKDYDDDFQALSRARGKRPIFDCFWNGRLIPSTTVSEFKWCSCPVRDAPVPAECYSRISGVLFTDDAFKVTQNKLTFMDLDLQLKNKDTIFTTAVNGQNKTYKRGSIEREFTQWLTKCHQNFDKQVKFQGYIETITRTDLKSRQHPWATFSAIEWDGKVYKAGQLVKSLKTQPIYYGTVCRFLLYGSHDGDTFGPGGHVEIIREPRDLYNMQKAFAISKIDRAATDEIIKKNIDINNSKLPEKLKVEWPDGNQWPPDAVRPAGSSLGPIKVTILNSKGDSMSCMPKGAQGSAPRLSVRITVTYHGSDGNTQEFSFDAKYYSKFNYWFHKYENLTKIGKYTVTLEAILNESSSSVSRQRPLPSFTFQFTITAGEADSFVLEEICQTVRVGVPFEIPLQIKDAYGHLTVPPPKLIPLLKCSGLELTYASVDNNSTFTIKGVTASGKVQNYQQSKNYDLKVSLVGLKNDTQILKINLLPGLPRSLHVTLKENSLRIENGNQVDFNIEVHDVAGNITANPKQMVGCQIQGCPPKTVDCSKTGTGQFGMPINLKIIKGESQILKVNFELIIAGNVLLASKELTVLPSTRVVRMDLYSHEDDLVFKNNDKIEWPAGGVLENLFYKLYDEGGREVALNAKIASQIKVTWTNDVNLKSLMKGKLPDLHVPTKVSDRHFHQVTYQDQFVSSSFAIIPHPGEPTRLKATVPENVVKLGETLSKNIILELVDQYDNLTVNLTPPCVNMMSVEAEGLEKSNVAFLWQEENSSVAVTGVRFMSGTPGSREMCFAYSDYVAHVTVKVTPGIPAELKLVSGPAQPLQVLNNQGISTPFVVQLCDKWGNPSPDQRVFVEINTSPQGLQVLSTVSSPPFDGEGKACFNVDQLSGPKGNYELKFQGSLNNMYIDGPSVNLTVLRDPKKPVNLSVQYDAPAKFSAGGVFPVFTVTVVSDEGSPVQNLSPAFLSMFLWKGPSTGNLPPQKASQMKCSQPLQNDRNDRFYFRDKKIPELVGNYFIQFSLQVCKDEPLYSVQIPVNVVANQPVRLSPECQISSPSVSYSKDISHRILVTDMTLCIVDMHGNPAGQGLDGRVSVSIGCPEGDGTKTIPLFEYKHSRCQINLVDGKARITNLAIMENSPGENGSSYTLLFQPELNMPFTPLEPYKLPFNFYNDSDYQRKMSEMTKKKDELTNGIKAYKDMFDTYRGLLKMLTDRYNDARHIETVFQERLSSMNITISPAVTIQNITRMIQEKTDEAERICVPRRVCNEPDPFKAQPDVLGKVCHLATVHDDAAAWVISWHIGNKMKCVVGKTTEAAQRIYKDTKGVQMVLALDSVYVSPDRRSLPHERNGRMLFDPPGNLVSARSLLVYSEDQESCGKVFKTLLGDTIVIDDLHSANTYRREVVRRKIPCPTLLTRDGERVSSQGIFGGLQNKAPPMGTLEYVFGAPLPPQYIKVTEEKKMLVEYKTLVENTMKAEHDKEQHFIAMTSPENEAHKQEMLAKQEQLSKLERELESMQTKPVKRQLESDASTSGISAKRQKI